MIKAERLVKVFGPIRAVSDVSFEVNPGDVLGFLGPNGAGKSTTMKMLTGFLPPTGGRASIGGFDVAEQPIEAKKLLGYLPETGPLYPEMTVLEFLRFTAEIRGMTGHDGANAINQTIGVCHLERVLNQPIDTLSKGYRQRVGMAQAVLHDPPCLIMDEPTDGLDPNQKQTVRKLIASMAEEKAIILSTHILEEVEAMCNRVIIINEGAIRVDETPAQLIRRHPLHNSVIIEAGNIDEPALKNALTDIRPAGEIMRTDSGWLIRPAGAEELLPALLEAVKSRNWNVSRIGYAPTPMEDVFAQLTSESYFDDDESAA